MTLYVQNTVRQNLTGSSTNSTYDSIITLKGTEADQWVVRKFKEIYERSNKLASLPIFNLTDGTVNGASVQDIKDLASNRTTYLCCITLKQFDAVKEYKDLIADQLAAIEQGLQTEEDIYFPAATV